MSSSAAYLASNVWVCGPTVRRQPARGFLVWLPWKNQLRPDYCSGRVLKLRRLAETTERGEGRGREERRWDGGEGSGGKGRGG